MTAVLQRVRRRHCEGFCTGIAKGQVQALRKVRRRYYEMSGAGFAKGFAQVLRKVRHRYSKCPVQVLRKVLRRLFKRFGGLRKMGKNVILSFDAFIKELYESKKEREE